MKKPRIGFNFWDGMESEGPSRPCDHPGCPNAGVHRAPKSRNALRDYYWFCAEHAAAYNKNWNYCAGMSDAEVEDHLRQSLLGERPTWPASFAKFGDEGLRRRVFEAFGFEAPKRPPHAKPTPEEKALKTLELAPPVTLPAIRRKYRELVKQLHPDANAGDRSKEDRLKEVIQAWRVLKAAHEIHGGA